MDLLRRVCTHISSREYTHAYTMFWQIAFSLFVSVGLYTFTESGHFCTGPDCFLCSKLLTDTIQLTFTFIYQFLSPPPSSPPSSHLSTLSSLLLIPYNLPLFKFTSLQTSLHITMLYLTVGKQHGTANERRPVASHQVIMVSKQLNLYLIYMYIQICLTLIQPRILGCSQAQPRCDYWLFILSTCGLTGHMTRYFYLVHQTIL